MQVAAAECDPKSTGAAETSFAWQVEEAKLLWAQGQQGVAVSMSKSLLAAARHNKQGNLLPYARLLSLTAKWLAQTRYSKDWAIFFVSHRDHDCHWCFKVSYPVQ